MHFFAFLLLLFGFYEEKKMKKKFASVCVCVRMCAHACAFV